MKSDFVIFRTRLDSVANGHISRIQIQITQKVLKLPGLTLRHICITFRGEYIMFYDFFCKIIVNFLKNNRKKITMKFCPHVSFVEKKHADQISFSIFFFSFLRNSWTLKMFNNFWKKKLQPKDKLLYYHNEQYPLYSLD